MMDTNTHWRGDWLELGFIDHEEINWIPNIDLPLILNIIVAKDSS